MKNLILIFAVFFSLSAIGADKPIGSVYGLEGFGKEGVRIFVTDHSDKYKAHSKIRSILKKRLVLGLKNNKIEVNGSSSDYIYVDYYPVILDGDKRPVFDKNGLTEPSLYVAVIKAKRSVTYQANGKTYSYEMTAYDNVTHCFPESLRLSANYHNVFSHQLGSFLIQWIFANPKKKE